MSCTLITNVKVINSLEEAGMDTSGLRPVQFWVSAEQGRCAVVCTCDMCDMSTWRNTVRLELRNRAAERQAYQLRNISATDQRPVLTW